MQNKILFFSRYFIASSFESKRSSLAIFLISSQKKKNFMKYVFLKMNLMKYVEMEKKKKFIRNRLITSVSILLKENYFIFSNFCCK